MLATKLLISISLSFADEAASEGDGEEETEEEERAPKDPQLSPKTAKVAAEIDEVITKDHEIIT